MDRPRYSKSCAIMSERRSARSRLPRISCSRPSSRRRARARSCGDCSAMWRKIGRWATPPRWPIRQSSMRSESGRRPKRPRRKCPPELLALGRGRLRRRAGGVFSYQRFDLRPRLLQDPIERAEVEMRVPQLVQAVTQRVDVRLQPVDLFLVVLVRFFLAGDQFPPASRLFGDRPLDIFPLLGEVTELAV